MDEIKLTPKDIHSVIEQTNDREALVELIMNYCDQATDQANRNGINNVHGFSPSQIRVLLKRIVERDTLTVEDLKEAIIKFGLCEGL